LPCDPHYSVMGHKVMAEAILDRLEAGQLLPVRASSPLGSAP
jgi:hypothetical protein